ncbi:hypothetical protein [Pseudarthrobacter sp. LT1]|uniref:hypothetical protein n=1 Tax=Pseudarthrobacter sp. LT1 TaxID=3111450 RepID=UPI002D77319A|nr:hypothetical protein [Pseudarthrobacter sp. LT1]WRT15607.1 hypothetical protein VIK36_09075 [Pseudarthrobacter sp. LT1]
MMMPPSNDPQFLWISVSGELPKWTDVVSALATGFAAVVALFVGAYSLQVALKERQDRIKRESAAAVREQERLTAEKLSQAERITCWMVADNTAVPANWINVDNASAQPIWDVEVRHELLLPHGSHAIPVVPASSRHRLNVNPGLAMRPAQVVEVSFRDNLGRRWRRSSSPSGSLEEK